MTDVRTEVRSALSVKIPSTTTSPPLPTQSTPPVPQTTAPPTTSSSPCCEGGRPLVTDPHSGQTICSCRLASPLLAGAYRVPGLPESMYSTAAYAAHAGYPAFSPTDPSTFYPALNSAYALKDSMEAWSRAGLPTTAGVYPYDMAAYPYGYAGMDLNGARRKNATRESTSTLKAWLQEHIKNPYPTKGEKIMLAIITKMTLTQVSTWFANARRRLKKENKMTWSPKNRCDDDDDDDDIKDGSDGEEKERTEERRSEDEEDEHIDLTSTSFEDRLASPPRQPEKSSPSNPSEKVTKPKIWSLADTATSASPPSVRRSPPTTLSFTPHSSAGLTSPSSVWSPATLYSGAYTYTSPFHAHQRYGTPLVPGLTKVGEDMRNSVLSGTRIPAFNGVSVSEASLLHPAFSGVPAAFRPVEKALIPR